MKQKNPELILHFFVAQDSKGKPRQLEIHLIPEKEVSMGKSKIYRIFTGGKGKCTNYPRSKPPA